MQDRFKFRSWYTNYDGKQEMIYEAQATYDNRCSGEGSFYHTDFQELLDDKRAVTMQCTGLKDKNGKLIYEGDILSFNENKNDKAIVKYGEYCAVDFIDECQCQVPSIGFYYETVKTDAISQLEPFCWDIQLHPFLLQKTNAEIIGNKYENPELLEGGQ